MQPFQLQKIFTAISRHRERFPKSNPTLFTPSTHKLTPVSLRPEHSITHRQLHESRLLRLLRLLLYFLGLHPRSGNISLCSKQPSSSKRCRPSPTTTAHRANTKSQTGKAMPGVIPKYTSPFGDAATVAILWRPTSHFDARSARATTAPARSTYSRWTSSPTTCQD